MNHRDILKLRELKDFFKHLSDEYYYYSNDENIEELERARYKGRSQAYDIAADRIENLIENDISRVAKWIPEGIYKSLYRCSYCGNAEGYPYEFCKKCGCEMRGG